MLTNSVNADLINFEIEYLGVDDLNPANNYRGYATLSFDGTLDPSAVNEISEYDYQVTFCILDEDACDPSIDTQSFSVSNNTPRQQAEYGLPLYVQNFDDSWLFVPSSSGTFSRFLADPASIGATAESVYHGTQEPNSFTFIHFDSQLFGAQIVNGSYSMNLAEVPEPAPIAILAFALFALAYRNKNV